MVIRRQNTAWLHRHSVSPHRTKHTPATRHLCVQDHGNTTSISLQPFLFPSSFSDQEEQLPAWLDLLNLSGISQQVWCFPLFSCPIFSFLPLYNGALFQLLLTTLPHSWLLTVIANANLIPFSRSSVRISQLSQNFPCFFFLLFLELFSFSSESLSALPHLLLLFFNRNFSFLSGSVTRWHLTCSVASHGGQL